MKERKTHKVAIVGGGITGLSVAYYLSKSKTDLALVERGSRLGGLVASFNLGQVRLEKYFHHIFRSDTHVREVISETGLSDHLDWRTANMGYYSNDRIYPFDTPLDLLRFQPLSFMDRIRLGARIWQTGKDPQGKQLDDRTVKEWIEKEWSSEIYHRFWKPLLISKFGDSEPDVSAAWLWGRIFARANSRKSGREELGYLRGGFLEFFDAMEKVIRTSGGSFYRPQEALSVRKKTDGTWIVETKDFEIESEVVVLAIPSPLISPLCKDMPPEERMAHENIEYQTILCMPITMDRPLSKIYWLNIGDSSIPFAGVIEQTNLVPYQDYGGAHVAYLFNYLSKNHPRLGKSKMEVFEEYESGLKRVFPKYRREQVQKVMMFKDQFATPIYLKNYLRLMPPTRSGLETLFYANTSHIFPDDRNMNFSIELGKNVARDILGYFHS